MAKRPKCYLCKQRVPRKAFRKLGYDITQCPACKLYSLRFKGNYKEFIEEYYNEEFFTGSEDRAGYVDYEGDSWPEQKNMQRYLSRITHYKKSGRLLDCGCATGIFMAEAEKSGFEVNGFDVSDYAVEKAQIKFPEKVTKDTLQSIKFDPETFDVITLFDVIEHLEEPLKALRRLKRMLKNDGLLMINTGDVGSWLARIEGKNWHFFIPPQHFFFFSRNTITMLLEQVGFKVIKIDYKGKWVSVRYFLNLYKQIYANKLGKFLYNTIGVSPLGRIPLYINLFDNMVVYAQKKSSRTLVRNS